ncbi:MAG TPA: DUF2213 domain-containing protein [Candidatus Binatia bacterium]|nr:DUF2213 domain-containing protein [Candidatus Binatia bacterium]
MSLTPAGFLICEDVPIARTGEQLYRADEVPMIEPGSDSLVHIQRDPEEVFDAATIASFQGVPFTNGHPPEGVSKDNWQELTVGFVLNPRRGTAMYENAIVADIQVMDPLVQAFIGAGKREVSAGYDCDYEDLGNGRGKQRRIRGNHVALVDLGRCGAECRIGDENPEGASPMNWKKWLEQLKAAIAGKDETKTKALLDAPPAGVTLDETGGVHVHLGETESAGGRGKWNDEAIEKKFEEHGKMIGDMSKMVGDNHKSVMDAIGELSKKMEGGEKDAAAEREIEGALKEEAPAGTGDAMVAAKDSAMMGDLYRQTLSLAEIIAPGIHMPTFDSAAKPTVTYRTICATRRKALTVGANDSATNGMIEVVLGKPLTNDSMEKMPCGQVRSVFQAVAAMKRNANNDAHRTHRVTDSNNNNRTETKGPMTPAQINAANTKFWGARS